MKYKSYIPLERAQLASYLGNASWLLGEKVARILITFGLWILIARSLGPRDFGLLNFATSFVALFAALTSLGLETLLPREILIPEADVPTVLGTGALLRAITSASIVAGVFAWLYLSGSERAASTLIAVIAAASLLQPVAVVEAWFQAQVQSRRIALPRIVALALGATAKVGLLAAGAGALWFALCMLFEAIVLAACQIVQYRLAGCSLMHWRADRETARRLLLAALPLTFSALAVTVYMRIDQVMIQSMIGPEAVGQYSAAVSLSEAWLFVPVTFCGLLFPALARARQADSHRYLDRVQKLHDLVVCSAISLALIVTFCADDLIAQLFGLAYRSAGPVLTICIWSSAFAALGVAGSQWLLAEGLYRIMLYRTILGAVTNIALNLVLIPAYGLIGAASATLLSYGFAAYFSLALFPRARPAFVIASRSLWVPGAVPRLIGMYRSAA